jgi:hypothetical protein
MKFRKISLMLIIALCMAIVPVTASASAAISVNAMSSIHPGDAITIAGTSTFSEVIVQVVRPNSSNVFYDIAQVMNGTFSTSFTLSSSEAVGTYKVVAGQGDQVDSKDLVVVAPTVTSCSSSCTPGPGPSGPIPGTIVLPTPAPSAVPTANPKKNEVAVDQSANVVKTVKSDDGHVTTTVTQDAGKLADAFKQMASQDDKTGAAPTVTITADNAAGAAVSFIIPSSTLADAAVNTPNAVVAFKSNDGGYSLPISVIDFAAIAKSLGVENTNISIQVNIATVDIDINAKIKVSANNVSTTQLGTATDFSVTAVGNGKTVELNNFGTTYVERTIAFAIPIDANNATVTLYDPATGSLSFVPAVFEKLADGKTTVHFKRNGNSIYTVLSSTKTFTDINEHWAKSDIELLASKLVVSGVTDSSFAPDSNITRAEFAALLVRSLGLKPNPALATFTDVKSSDWFAGAVGSAVKAKLVSGFEDDSFKPNDTITREQMAVMVSRAIAAAGKKVDLTSSQAETLAKFADNSSISSWAQAAVAQSVQAKIISGMSDTAVVPSANASRAQAVVMLKRLLQFASFIN